MNQIKSILKITIFLSVLNVSTSICPLDNIIENNSKIFDLTYVYPEDMHGWFSPANKRNLKKFIDAINPRKVIEIGTWLGVSAIFMAKLLSPNAELFCIDPWVPYHDMDNMPECQERLKNAYERFLSNCIHHEVTHKIIPIRMKSIDAYKSYFTQITDIDLIYIDGSHAENDVYDDIMHWRQTLSPTGIICGDDYGWPSVRKAVLRVAEISETELHIDDNFWWFGTY